MGVYLPVYTNSLGDRLWFDYNQNGLQETNESGVSGVTVVDDSTLQIELERPYAVFLARRGFRVLPKTRIVMLIGCLALAGFPFFSGFFSKDEIVALFDVLNEKVGHLSKGGVAIHDIRQLRRIVRQERVGSRSMVFHIIIIWITTVPDIP